MNRLRKIRVTLAAVFFGLITLLFLDFTGTLHAWLSWMATIQFLPAILALHFVAVAVWVVLTLVFGRIYCSIICPLGVMQDVISWFSGLRNKRRKRRRFSYSPAKSWLRYGVLVVFIVALVAGIGSLAALLAPYSSYGRIAQNLFQPIYLLGNNALAYLAERVDSYAFYSREVWIRSLPTFLIALVTFIVLFVLAWRNGRTYCNTICPVGTVLSFFARFSLFKVHIDEDKCVKCGLCAKGCKASCIDFKNGKIDYSRCVVCGDCLGNCHKGALSFGRVKNEERRASKSEERKVKSKLSEERRVKSNLSEERRVKSEEFNGSVNSKASSGTHVEKQDDSSLITHHSLLPGSSLPDAGRRSFLLATAMATTAAALAQEKKKVDGGLAAVTQKEPFKRTTPITPPGSLSAQNMAQHCTACQLCVSQCPNDVLRPSTDLMHLMQPTMSYERGFCRPECHRCSEVCPAGAIKPIKQEDKSSIQIGHAVWSKKNCIVFTDGVECGNCARHCPSGAILMIPSDPKDENSPKFPAVDLTRCIGCGACENLCPAKPFSAIHVEGHEVHKYI